MEINSAENNGNQMDYVQVGNDEVDFHFTHIVPKNHHFGYQH